jgi:hypothetical protein
MTVKEYVLRRLNQGETDLKVLARQTRIQIRDVLGLKPANLQRHRPEPAPSFFTLSKRKGLPHLSGRGPELGRATVFDAVPKGRARVRFLSDSTDAPEAVVE